jgi:hypothetical protein
VYRTTRCAAASVLDRRRVVSVLDAGTAPRASGGDRSARPRERLVEVGEQIVDVLDPDRQAHRVRGHAGGRELLLRELRVGGRGVVDRQRLRVADVRQVAEQLESLDEGAARVEAALHAERHERPVAAEQRRFGTRIALLVAAVSDDPSIADYDERKRELRARVARADSATCAIFAADKIAKVRELALLPRWRLHDRSTQAKLAHYHSSLEMLRRVASDTALVDRFDTELAQLVAPADTGLTASR